MGQQEVTAEDENMGYRNEKWGLQERVQDLLTKLTLEEKMGLLTSEQPAIERLGIKERHIGTEYARGWSSHDETQFCTVFPQTIGMASTFDEELIYEAGKIAGRESRAYYNSVNKSIFGFGPTVDMERAPRWGRHEEGYGEDPCLSGVMSTAYCKGIVGEGKVKQALPLLKHFICNNTETNRATYDVSVSEKLLNEYYLEPFRKAIEEGGAFGVMGAYNKINGEPGLLTSLNQKYVKDKWGGKLVVSDGHAFAMVSEEHKYTNSYAETLALALKSGANIMLDAKEMVVAAAKEAYEEGLIDEVLLDKAVADTLTLRMMTGEFDSEDPYADITMDMVNTQEDKAFALKMCEEQMVLLKNSGILPLKKPLKIAVVGPQADENFMDWYTGASSYDITIKQGLEEAYPQAEILCDHARDIVKLKDARTGQYLRVAEDGNVRVDAAEKEASTFEKYDWGFGYVNFKDTKSNKMLQEDDNVLRCTAKDAYMWFVRPIMTPHEVENGVTFTSWNGQKLILNEQREIQICEEGEPAVFQIEVISDGDMRCIELAKQADIVITCVGNHPVQVGREGYDRESIALPPRQEKLAREMVGVNANCILMIVSSYPYGVDEFQETYPAVLYTTHAGPELGRAAANILSGKANPAGRLASTWYKKNFDFPSIFEYDIEKSRMTYLYLEEEALYPFGYGLSYSEFSLGDFAVQEETEKDIHFSVKVTNESDTDGDEVVQIYAERKQSSYLRPKKKLVAFRRVHLCAGETKQVILRADKYLLKVYDEMLKEMVLEQGAYIFGVGQDSRKYLQTVSYTIK